MSTVNEGEVASGFGAKQGIGKTGVHHRGHRRAEFAALSDEPRAELEQWIPGTLIMANLRKTENN